METMIAVSFEGSNGPYDAVTKLQELDRQGQIEVYEARIVERASTGEIIEKEAVRGSNDYAGGGVATASGGLIGLMLGVIGGPVGMLLGGTMGVTTGALIDFETEDRDDSVLGSFVHRIQPGTTALLAHINEQSYEVVDNAMRGLGGNVLRRPAAEVEAELAAAEEARDQAEHEARKQLRKERHEEKKADRDQKLDHLRSKFHKPEKAGAAS